jgi:hypothetical protein
MVVEMGGTLGEQHGEPLGPLNDRHQHRGRSQSLRNGILLHSLQPERSGQALPQPVRRRRKHALTRMLLFRVQF